MVAKISHQRQGNRPYELPLLWWTTQLSVVNSTSFVCAPMTLIYLAMFIEASLAFALLRCLIHLRLGIPYIWPWPLICHVFIAVQSPVTYRSPFYRQSCPARILYLGRNNVLGRGKQAQTIAIPLVALSSRSNCNGHYRLDCW